MTEFKYLFNAEMQKRNKNSGSKEKRGDEFHWKFSSSTFFSLKLEFSLQDKSWNSYVREQRYGKTTLKNCADVTNLKL